MSEDQNLTGKVKQVAMDVAERHVIAAIDDVYAVAQVYVDHTESPLDNTLLEGLKLLKESLRKTADKINGKDDL